jgi:uncharacterized protein (UPF0264 family)
MNSALLVSVRSPCEAAIACHWGADLIDIKEPSRGSLGRPEDSVIRSVLNQVAGKRPVSAAQGELRENAPLPWDWKELSFLKWGLSGCAGMDWQTMLLRRADRLGSRVVPVAYADAERAVAPETEDVLAFAAAGPWPEPVVLVDTFKKSAGAEGRRRTLLDCCSMDVIESWCEGCRTAGVRIALAGSLGMTEIERLLPLQPDWIGVRGGVCEGDRREDTISAAKVDNLVRFLRSSASLAD